MSCKSLLLLTFAFILATGEMILGPCSKDDFPCLKAAMESFITYPGNPNFGIAPMDPLTISSLEIPVKDIGAVFYLTNVKVTGLKNFETMAYEMNTDNKSVLQKFKANIKVTSDIEIKITKLQKSFKGIYTASATVEQTENYNYNLKTKGYIEYLEVGPESPSCQVDGSPTENISKALQSSLVEDSEVDRLRQVYLSKQVEYSKKTICKISDAAFKTVLNNYRVIASGVPKYSFFTDI